MAPWRPQESRVAWPWAGRALAAELLRSLAGLHRSGFLLPESAPLNDPLAVLVAANPALARTRPAHVAIELGTGPSYGRTAFDFYGRNDVAPNCTVVTGFDVAATRAAFLSAPQELPRENT
jgi:inosine-uridine nucleoside N-ribohydrolase